MKTRVKCQPDKPPILEDRLKGNLGCSLELIEIMPRLQILLDKED